MPSERPRHSAPRLRSGRLHGSIPRLTLLGFVASVVALFTVAGLSYRALQQRNEGTRRVDAARELAQNLEHLVSTLKDAETGQRGYLLTDDERYLAPYDVARVEVPRRLASLRLLVAEVPAQAERLTVLDATVADKLGELAETIELQRAGQRDAALAIVARNRGKVAMDRIRSVVDELLAATETELAERIRTWEDAVGWSTAIVMVGSLVLLGLIVGAAVLSSRDFHAQQRESWLRTGQNELALRMQGAQELGQLGDTIVAFIAEYVAAPVGALHFARAAGELGRVGGYGLDPAGDEDARPPAPGLTRDAMARGHPVVVDDVPPDFFPVTTAIGRSRPQHLVLAPTTADGTANGVLELGLFHPAGPEVLELLQRLADPIGTALRSAVDRRELVDLLEQTTRQAAVLQTQQEELRVSNEELDRQRREVGDALRLAELFVGILGHDLRNPLSAIVMGTQLLERTVTDEAQQKIVRRMASAGRRMGNMIAQMLDLTRARLAGGLGLARDRTRVDLAEQIQRAADELRGSYGDRDVRIEFEGECVAQGDRERLLQLFSNVVGNALEHGDPTAPVTVTCARDDDAVVVRVHNLGTIPAELLPTIFDPFRGRPGGTVRSSGLGLGLFISQQVALAHGGTLEVESSDARGTTFVVRLPWSA